AGNLFFLRQQAPHVLHRIGASFCNAFQNSERSLIGAAVQGPFEGADGRRNGGMHVRQGGRGDPGGKGGGIQFVVGVQDEGDVEGAFGGGRRLLPGQHQEEIGGVRERRVRFNHRVAFADAIVGGADHGYLRG